VASQQLLPKAGTPSEVLFMGAPLLDFSHLTPEQRIELAEQLWDSLEPARIVPPESDIDLLRARRADLARDGDPGKTWRRTIEELKERGA
jgi:putative addiction module component (TIGR02574 family)